MAKTITPRPMRSLDLLPRRSTRTSSRVLASTINSESSKVAKKPKAKPRNIENGEHELHIHELPNGSRNKVPATPPAKRVELEITRAPPETPTPAQIGLMAASYSTGDIDDASLPPIPADRPAEPHITNAPLKTPGGSRVTTYSEEIIHSSPSKTGIPRPTTTTDKLLAEACAHLINLEPKLKPVIEKHQCRMFSPEGLAEEIDPFRSLTSGIMAQQVSGAAANAIKNKFIGLFNPAPTGEEKPQDRAFPTPVQVAVCEVPFLRTAGLSQRKAEYIKGLAQKFVDGELSARMLVEASYEEVLEKLTAVRGLGKWSVEMFACFSLKRMDVFSTGDLGVQ